MANIGDSRFGQWANPRFGANLGAGTQGVLPAPGASQSASSGASNGLQWGESLTPQPGNTIPKWNGLQQGESLTPQPGNNIPKWNGLQPGERYAEGGVIEDSDTGNSQEAPSDPFSIVTEALNYGRKMYGVGQLFAKGVRDAFAGADKQLSRDINTAAGRRAPALGQTGEDVSRAVSDEGGSGDVPDDARAMTMNQALGGMDQDEGIQWGDTFVPGQRKDTMNLEEGGVIPDEGDETPAPDEGGGGSQQSAMAYLSGQGAVPPEVAQAMEQRVDPQGMMDPSERKMQALASAGSPDKAFGLMQHYRQKFMAYNTFAKAALQGAGGRPPNPAAAADALTKAYENVPDGQSMRFTPTRGGMQVSIRGGRKPKTQQFAEGGEVGYDDTYMSPPEDQAMRDTLADPSGAIAEAEGEGPSMLGRSIVLGWNSLMKLLEGPGLDYDKAVEDPDSLASVAPEGGAAEAAPAPQGVTSERPQDPQVARMNADPYTMGGVSPARNWRTPPVHEVVAEAQRDPNANTLEHHLHLARLAYPESGQHRERAMAELAVRQAWAKNQFGLDKEHVKADGALARATMSADTKERIANLNNATRERLVQTSTASAERRVMASYQGKIDLAQFKASAHWQEILGQEMEKNYRALVGAGVSPSRIPERMGQAPSMPAQNPAVTQGQPAPRAPQAPQVPQAQQAAPLPPAALSSLREGEHTKFRNGQVWTLQGGRPVQVQ